ncbi:GNAT family N-acetyltransferase [Catenuloplanes atrovinosus]|uniref:GNAT superfamily N-acetyltransferase n=1 Tax=Catenuloplanes atrovinosus TaxID=137266 RepID=A0AAE3YUZ7_9ACTN|nr:GNAT family N-acetyltransferase [Catenuloplanes atrovinosus]MDR7280388.1 GNAT superfamily N-acetyltransferase [Catenuloplanes atrovinosus]
MSLRVTAVDLADDPECGEATAIMRLAGRTDTPDLPVLSQRRYLSRLRNPQVGERRLGFLARADGVAVGTGLLVLPDERNRDTAMIEVHVLPEHRRRGAGRALHEHLTGIVRGEGRTTVLATTSESLPGGPARPGHGSAFAEALGYRRASTAHGQALDLDDVPVERLLSQATPHTAGYSPVLWTGEVPEADVEDIAYLNGRLLLDAPTGELELEAEKPDPSVIRAYERGYRDKGGTLFHAAMRDDATGRLVAWTMIEQLDEPVSWGWQQITLVDPAHRGHRLGMAVKIHNHLQVRAKAPELRHLHTWNSAANTHMMAINAALGFRPAGATIDWQRRF